MASKHYPETIEHRWDILYRDYPEIYDRFASFPYTPAVMDLVARRFDLKGKTVVDNGAGTGRSTVELARYAANVIGVEPEAAMRAVAMERARTAGLENVTFVEGRGQDIPLPAGCADVVTAFTAGFQSLPEAKRLLRRPGLILVLDVTPGYYGGDLNRLLEHPTPELQNWSDLLAGHGFVYEDIETVQTYGTTENIVATYGFIFGRKAIAHLKQSGQTSIRWTFRLQHLWVTT